MNILELLKKPTNPGLLPIAQGYAAIEQDAKIAQDPAQKWKLQVKTASHSYTCVMVNLPLSFNEDIHKTIDPDDLYTEEEGHGLEIEPHVTVLYGLHTNDASDVSKVIKDAGIKSIKLCVKSASLFDAEKYDVLKYDIESDDLMKLNALLRSKLEYTSKFKDYHPHATIAYLKKGRGKKYVSDMSDDKEYKSLTYVFSPAVGQKVTLPFSHHHLMSRMKEKISMVKEALRTERQQHTQTAQVTRHPTAVIVKGNPEFIKGNEHATLFYNELANLVRQKGYSVTFDPGKEYTQPSPANVWLGHSRGVDRLRFAPKGTKTIGLGAPGGINHPLDNASHGPGQMPNLFHYQLTKQMKAQIMKQLDQSNEKATTSKTQRSNRM